MTLAIGLSCLRRNRSSSHRQLMVPTITITMIIFDVSFVGLVDGIVIALDISNLTSAKYCRAISPTVVAAIAHNANTTLGD
jgi:hypothetical protein